MDDLWKDYVGDFTFLTDEELEKVADDYQAIVDQKEQWLEAYASWKAAGKPRG